MQFASCPGLALGNAIDDLDATLSAWRQTQPIAATTDLVVASGSMTPSPSSTMWNSVKAPASDIGVPEAIPPRSFPNDEIYRQQALSQMRSQLTSLCQSASGGSISNVEAEIFDKWQYARLQPLHDKATPCKLMDCLIPYGEDIVIDATLAEDLRRLSPSRLSEAASKTIVKQLGHLGARAVRNARLARDQPPARISKTIHDCFVHLAARKISVKVRQEHFDKLLHMYRGPPGQLDESVFTLLLRYSSLADTGMQAACHESVFEVLHRRLDVRMECFASPLNCYFTSQFASLFADTDAVFGSVGSFFSLRPTSGSYQANPPFIDELIDRMATRMNELLTDTKEPLSFVVVVPRRSTTNAWMALHSHRYIRAEATLQQKSHGFCDGAQHRRPSRYKISTCDTSVFFLQNTAGSLKYPVSSAVLNELLLAFRSRQRDELQEQFITRKKRKMKRDSPQPNTKR